MVLDIEFFNGTIDKYGQDSGNIILLETTKHLRRCCNDAIIARCYADIFLVYVSYQDMDEYEILINKILNIPPIVKYGIVVQPKLRVGAYLIENNKNEDRDFNNILNLANLAHQWAKKELQAVVYYNEDLKKQIQFSKNVVNIFKSSLEKGELEVYFQAKNNMLTKEIIGAEALIRWNNAEYGFISPAVFIPLLEASGDVIEVDFFVLEESCKIIQNWIKTGHKVISISVNQSKVNFQSEDYMNRLKELVEKYNIPRNAIELEITETLFEDSGLTQEIIEKMKSIGFAISLDDFGTGYSSLSMLSRVELDTIKIDKSLVDNSEKSSTARTILSKVISMAHELNLKVICEGVEKEEQAALLLNIGCVYAQGYLYNKPVPKDEFLKLVDDKD